jgi:hypothetical protein
MLTHVPFSSAPFIRLSRGLFYPNQEGLKGYTYLEEETPTFLKGLDGK